MIEDFAVFILTHGRPGAVTTYSTLRRQKYTGPVYLVIDDEDATAPEYLRLYKDQVIVFSKSAVAKTFDECDNFRSVGRETVVYARNACFDIARALGVTYFLQLDDDYSQFQYRFNAKLEYEYKGARDLDRLFSAILDYYKSISALTIAISQGGDMLGGRWSRDMGHLTLKRKAMNTFFCSTERPLQHRTSVQVHRPDQRGRDLLRGERCAR